MQKTWQIPLRWRPKEKKCMHHWKSTVRHSIRMSQDVLLSCCFDYLPFVALLWSAWSTCSSSSLSVIRQLIRSSWKCWKIQTRISVRRRGARVFTCTAVLCYFVFVWTAEVWIWLTVELSMLQLGPSASQPPLSVSTRDDLWGFITIVVVVSYVHDCWCILMYELALNYCCCSKQEHGIERHFILCVVCVLVIVWHTLVDLSVFFCVCMQVHALVCVIRGRVTISVLHLFCWLDYLFTCIWCIFCFAIILSWPA